MRGSLKGMRREASVAGFGVAARSGLRRGLDRQSQFVELGRDPVGSMGNDAALACMSDKARMIYDYFKQMFAQVTNPPIDSIREEIIMSLECHVGPEANLLQIEEANCARMRIRHPILSNEGLEAFKQMNYRGWTSMWKKIPKSSRTVRGIETECIGHLSL